MSLPLVALSPHFSVSSLVLEDSQHAPWSSARTHTGAIRTAGYRQSAQHPDTPRCLSFAPVSLPCWDLTLGLSSNAPGHHLSPGMLASHASVWSYPFI